MLSQIALGVTLSLLILLTVCGNVLVCLAVFATRRLRSVTNCFIVSLAVTDLLLGILVLPFSTLLEVTGDWPLGAHFCNIYISLDVMLSTASILNLLAISVDRFFAVTAPLRYPTLLLPWRVGASLATIWLVSVGVSFVPIHLGWNTVDHTVQNHGEGDPARGCRFELNPTYVVVDAFATFYLPLLAMCWMYHRVFRIARAQAKRIVSTYRGPNAALNSSSLPGVTALALREHKATVTLAAVLGAFVICWFPYFTFFTIMGIREETNLPRTAYSVVLWLGYTNSALNPLLYAALNRDFRSAYGRLLFGGKEIKTPTGTPPVAVEVGLMDGHTPACSRVELMPEGCIMLQDMNTGRRDGSNGTAVTMVTVLSNGHNRYWRHKTIDL
ncbi:histamine receptor H2a [Pygocentrus nattereri]|uniref:histamine receptor H2a n=1 Tax=Pygocentrus nattereri TaxID=42514 RepID=UPI0008148F45|nr:histamine receptor H2a [Pygocentrus nattereri]XP_017572408.1 histamine receptor H2a [Pygocentrus nattereri]